MVIGHGERAEPRRFHTRVLGPDWGCGARAHAPGRITIHRLQGAIVVYLSAATIFANAFSLVWELIRGAYSNLPSAAPGPSEFATMFYFSLATLTTTGNGDIVPLYPFARSLASLESVIEPFYLAITVARPREAVAQNGVTAPPRSQRSQLYRGARYSSEETRVTGHPRGPADKKPCGDRPEVARRHLTARTSRRGARQNAAALQLPTSRLHRCRISRAGGHRDGEPTLRRPMKTLIG